MKTVVSKKKIHYSCEDRIEKSIPRDHRLSSLGKPRDAKRRSSGRIFLSFPHTYHRLLLGANLKDVTYLGSAQVIGTYHIVEQ